MLPYAAPLFHAAITGDEDALDAALAQDPELDDLETLPQVSPLMLAARAGHLSTMARLLAAGASLELANAQGLTALHVAAMANQRAAVAALLEIGADPLQPIGQGGSVPHLAAAMGAVEVLKLLAARNIDLDVEDAEGRTPEDYAHRQQQQAALDFFRHRRARRFYDDLCGLRERLRILAHQLPPPPPPPASAALPDLLTLPVDTIPDTGAVRSPPMRSIADALEPVNSTEWERICAQHAAWLQAGGADGTGSWDSLIQSGVTFAVYRRAMVDVGAQADLHVRRLEGVHADGVDLRYAHLVGIVADEVSFRRSWLSGAMMTDASLRGACLDGADLSRADLSRADLREASFVGADLTGTDLECCDLRGADFRGAILRGTRFLGADLRGALR